MRIVLVYFGLIIITASICLNTIYFDETSNLNNAHFVEISGIAG